VSWYQKGTTNLDFTEARDSEWQWHQLGCMQVCTQVVQDKGATWMRWYQKGKTNLDFTEARDSEWQCHQLGCMQVCTQVVQDKETTWVRWYQKGKTNLDFTEVRDSEWQWHQLGNMQVCISLQTDNHASTPPLSFLQARCHSCRPTDSIKALKVHSHHRRRIQSK